MRFGNDQLTERVMIRDMGKGNRDIEIVFGNPIIVTQRYDEGLATLENFTHPKAAENDYYPEGAFGYSATLPSILRFQHPVEFHAIWLKKHRSSEFYLKNSAANYLISGYLGGKLVLQAQVLASSILWKHYQPHETLIIDLLVIPPGVDFDNLLVGVDMGSEELMIKQ